MSEIKAWSEVVLNQAILAPTFKILTFFEKFWKKLPFLGLYYLKYASLKPEDKFLNITWEEKTFRSSESWSINSFEEKYSSTHM